MEKIKQTRNNDGPYHWIVMCQATTQRMLRHSHHISLKEIEPTQRKQHKNNSTHHLNSERATVLISSVIIHIIPFSKLQQNVLEYRVSTTPCDLSRKAGHNSLDE